MKTLLQINTVVNSGSTGRIAEETGQLALTKGWESYIAYGRNKQPSKSKLIKIGTKWDINIHGLQTRILDRHGLASKKATKGLVKQISKIKPDVIHLHNLHGYYLNIEVLFNYLSSLNTPVILTLHDCWPITGHCIHFDFVGCEKWKKHCYQCPQKSEYPSSLLLDRSSNNYALKKILFSSLKNLTLVAVSQWLANIVNQSYLKNYPINVINNGIDTKVFKPVQSKNIRIKYNIQNKFILLGIASIWSSRKGLNDFIELSRMLDSNYIVILVGLAKKQIKNLPINILGIEQTENRKELVQLYSNADVVLNISYEETFGLTTVEGFACGTPGIVYNATASPELLDEATGIIVEKGDINGLVEAIHQIKEKEKNYYTEACVKRANQFYKKEDRYQEYFDLYDYLIK